MTDTVPTTRGPRLALPSFVPDIIARADRPFATILVAWLLCGLGAYAIVFVMDYVAPRVDTPNFDFYVGKGMFTVMMIAVITPLLETLILGAVCWILSRFLSIVPTIVFGSLIAALFHSLNTPIWGLVIWWPFLIFSTLLMVWKERSLLLGILIPTIVHGLHNLPVTLQLAYPDLIKLPV